MAAVTRRTVTITDEAVPSIVVPRGRTAAERRIAAVAALHAPQVRIYADVLGRETRAVVCGECKVSDRMGDATAARWPCATARLLGPWPGEPEET